MKLKSFFQAIIFLFVTASSTVWAQNQELSPLQMLNVEPPEVTGPLKEIIDGKYAPDIYRINADDDDERRLIKQQINCLYAEYSDFKSPAGFGAVGEGFIENFLDVSRRLSDARLAYHSDPEERRKIMSEQLKDAKLLEAMCAARLSIGTDSMGRAAKVAYFRIKVELALLHLEKTEAGKTSQK